MSRYPAPPEVEVIRVVRVAFLRGEGVEPDPVRQVVRFYDLEGALLAEVDPAARTVYPNDGGELVPREFKVGLVHDR